MCLKGQWSPSVTGYPLGGSGQAMSTTDPVALRGLQLPQEWMWGPWEHRLEEESQELRFKKERGVSRRGKGALKSGARLQAAAR